MVIAVMGGSGLAILEKTTSDAYLTIEIFFIDGPSAVSGQSASWTQNRSQPGS